MLLFLNVGYDGYFCFYFSFLQAELLS
ncbi:hypothetical protein RLOC_00005136 [Lonchura striata]|uniref:Uncharacterized protein n=1 Tax=Lonchura striata TaxID=40157 RepID=A0A218UZ90_9PASE|nr:hypothetical protein RLOC_00005136 [Lonchura striata domestica]